MSSTEVKESETHVDASELKTEIDKVVDQVKKAVIEVDKDRPSGTDRLPIKDVGLTLRAGVKKEAGGDFKFKLFGHDFGGGGKLTRDDTQTIELKLTPRKGAEAFGKEDVSEKLVEAIRSIRDSASDAAASEPRFDMSEASVELNFEIDKHGEINFIVAGAGDKTTSQTVKLTLGEGDSSPNA